MKRRIMTGALAACAACLQAGLRAEEALDKDTQNRIEEFEKGPATIDVSKYPAAIQARYEIFLDRCSQCHTLARPINSTYALPQEWSRYVKRMMRKPGSGITPKKAKQIYEFLAYDSNFRKKELLEEKLAEADDEEKTEAEAKIREVLDEFGAPK